MRNFLSQSRNWILFIALLLIIMIGIGALTFISGSIGILPGSPALIETAIVVSPVPTIDGTPIERFAEIDPAIAQFLEVQASNFGNTQLDTLTILQPGIYLPRSGDVQFELVGPTPLPTPLPFPTSPPLPVPALNVLPVPTATPTPVPPTPVPRAPASNNAAIIPTANVPQPPPEPTSNRVVPYSEGECAPTGLPVDGILTQRYHRYHSGIDLGIPLNTPVIATHSGQVTYADWSAIGYGYLVIIQNAQFITYYAHNNSFNVNPGDLVGKGSIWKI